DELRVFIEGHEEVRLAAAKAKQDRRELYKKATLEREIKHFESIKLEGAYSSDICDNCNEVFHSVASLCEVSEMKVTTKTDDDDISQTYSINQKGDITDKKPSHLGRGTVISACKLFNNLPVRKQYYANSQRKKDDLKKIEDFLLTFSIIKPLLRITFRHNKELIWQKHPANTIKDVLHSVLSRPVANQLMFREKTIEKYSIHVSAYIPKPGSDAKIMSRSSAERTFVAVNERPVILKDLIKVLKQYYNNCHPCDATRYPICFIHVNVPSCNVDVNVDPNKTTVFMENMKEVRTCLEEILLEVYGSLDHVPSWHYTSSDEVPPQKEANDSSSSSIVKNIPPLSVQHLGCKEAMKDKNEMINELIESRCIMPLNNNNTFKNLHATDQNNLVSSLLPDREMLSEKLLADRPKNVDSNNGTICLNQGINNTPSVTVIQSSPVSSLPQCSSMRGDILELTDSLSHNISHFKTTLARQSSESIQDAFKKSQSSSVCLEDDASLLHYFDDVNVDLVFEEDKTNTVLGTRSNSDRNAVRDSEETKEAGCWSRGNLLDSHSNLIEPVQLLAPTSRHAPGKHVLDADPTEQADSPAKRKKTAAVLDANQSTLYEAFGLNPVNKELSPFEQFCREQGQNSTGVNLLPGHDDSLQTAWENLSEVEKMKYIPNQHPQLRKEKSETVKKVGKDLKPLKAVMPSVRDQVVAMAAHSQAEKSKKRLKKKVYRTEKNMKFDVSDLRRAVQRSNSEQDSSRVTFSYLTVIGQTRLCEAWLCGRGNSICMLNVHRLAEMNLYRKLKETYRFQAKLCSKTISLEPRCFSETIWSTLKLLAYASRTKDANFSISDERIVFNGFDIKCYFGADQNLKAELVGLCDLIPAYAVDDLCEILENINKFPAVTLGDVRPIKAQYYLQGETVRILKQDMANKTLADVQAMLDSAPDISDSSVCFHHKTIFHNLIDLTDN
ncbi:hypothetical protein Btru_028019, partial [Bulinus truncatus]